MGSQAGPHGFLGPGRTEVKFSFVVTPSAISVTVSADDEMSVFHAAGEIAMQRNHDRGWLHQMIGNASRIVEQRARALRRYGYDREVVSEWNEFACAAELLRLLRLGIRAEQGRRGLYRGVDLRHVGGSNGSATDGAPDRPGAEQLGAGQAVGDPPPLA